jgi:sortase A
VFRKRRSVDELSAEELERLLLLKKREERAERLRQLAAEGRVVGGTPGQSEAVAADVPHVPRAEPKEPRIARVRPLREAPPPRPPRRINWGMVRERILLFIEVAALIGLAVVLFNAFLDLREMNRDVAEASGSPEPTPTATALIEVRILPGGHEPPVAGQEPVPAPYRNLIAPVTPMPIPTPGPEQATRIVIPAINVDGRVVEGDTWDQLKKGVGHHVGSANPGERGNCVLSGHDDVYGEIFKDLNKLELEDEIIVYTGVQPYRYRVVSKRIIQPTEVEVMDPTPDPIVTLITCYPYRIDTHRIVVVAALEE